ncbi:uncharacterized protein LOC117173270 [Belonocnema kinseyi]|uniref:uncharacterized protein LOC117173270 n=1 Tax=Belonocnema kinseyi TaxID=2817044 RepID=UPI00143DDEE7|nr:uncharacterized protein LOC117173270 [Belonocnema kinseyi]
MPFVSRKRFAFRQVYADHLSQDKACLTTINVLLAKTRLDLTQVNAVLPVVAIKVRKRPMFPLNFEAQPDIDVLESSQIIFTCVGLSSAKVSYSAFIDKLRIFGGPIQFSSLQINRGAISNPNFTPISRKKSYTIPGAKFATKAPFGMAKCEK